VRRRNLVRREQFPYTTPNGNIIGSGDYEGLLARAVEKIGYEEIRAQQRSSADAGPAGPSLLGVGVVIGLEPGGRNAARDMAIFPKSKQMPGAGGVEGATVKIEKNGSVVFTLGAPSCGQSHETTASQIVADVLGIAPDFISAGGGWDSTMSPWGVSCANSGNNFHLYDVGAVHGAAMRVRDKALTLAAHLLKADTATLQLREGAVHAAGDAITFAELGKIAYGNQALLPDGFEPGLEATYYHSHPHANPGMLPDADGRVRAQYTFGSAAHAALVEIDRQTGRVKVLRYVVVSDNGTMINPAVVDGQIYGSAAHGISVALGEGFLYGDDGQLLTLTLLDYGKSTTLETPHIEVEHHPIPDPYTTLGQKAAGEGAAIPSPAAIASAVENALSPFGAKIRHLPLTAERVWNLLHVSR
jgi:2-furoyl-CoA dehydrogenase large subunit